VWIDRGEAGAKVPQSIQGYHGRVLLIDFWDYTIINCIRDFPVFKRWYAKYHAYGFEIVGVHFGEFPMGNEEQNVRDAASRFRLPWPVVADIRGSMWKAYHSNMWPNRYLMDPHGEIVMHAEGETKNRALEEKIHALLEAAHPEVGKIPLDPEEDAYAPECGAPTEETYVGHRLGPGALENPKGYDDGSVTDYHAASEPTDGGVMLGGKWRAAQDGVVSADRQGKAELRYHARSAYAVLSLQDPNKSDSYSALDNALWDTSEDLKRTLKTTRSHYAVPSDRGPKKPVRLDLLQDGKPLERSIAGADVHFDSEGSYILVSAPRLYDLVKNTAFGSHLLTLRPQGGGITLHAFSYGNDCQQGVAPL
jgi:thiol-disulfide isomerase/thioredoxin